MNSVASPREAIAMYTKIQYRKNPPACENLNGGVKLAW